MAEMMHPITITIAEKTYNAAKEKAESRGYFSVEEYVSDWLKNDIAFEIPMTAELAEALEEGLAESREGRVVSLEELNRRHTELRAQWLQDHPA